MTTILGTSATYGELVTITDDEVVFAESAQVEQVDGGYKLTRPGHDGWTFCPDIEADTPRHFYRYVKAFHEDQQAGGNRRSWPADAFD